MSGQTLTDRIAAAQYQLTGSDVARAVCKATTHEVMAPKKKHLECEYSHHTSFLFHILALRGLYSFHSMHAITATSPSWLLSS